MWIDEVESWKVLSPHGDKMRWTDTTTMLADALTKSLKPFQLFKLMEEAMVQLSEPTRKLTKGEVQAMQQP